MDSLLVSGLKDMHEHGEGITWYMLGQYCPLSLFNHTRTVLNLVIQFPPNREAGLLTEKLHMEQEEPWMRNQSTRFNSPGFNREVSRLTMIILFKDL